MALFGGSCEHCADYRAQRDRAQAELSAILSEQAALMKDVMAVKRHELGLPPQRFEPKDPTAILGPRTKAAIDEMSSGYADLRGHNTNWAITQAAAMKANGASEDEIDAQIAHQIRMGDTE